MEGCIDFSVKSNCWNIYEALYICIGCGCCSPDKQKAAGKQIEGSAKTVAGTTRL